ncbi:MAG: hypothetical protein M1818_002732 [Claussenomyces sp. TS43310]|nr:MAG: hypothetical protein M1818_002732 [Claussenomyces sp. TS43310]
MEYVLPQINIVAGPMFWDENDPPADNILHARLRAKHHGAAVLTYRPFLKMILDRPRGSQHDPSAVCLHAGPSDGIPTKVLDFAERCIRAMERSTSAFLGMKGQGRLIVTNVWGTSHAQWGNVIVLLGCYRDEILSRFIDEETLKGHVRHVIDFLQSIAQPSSALKQDVRILSYMVKSTGLMTAEELRELGVEDEEPMMEGSSFSSSAST